MKRGKQMKSEADKSREIESRQRRVCDLAEQFLDAAIAKGEPFTEALSNWAMSKAEREAR